MNTPAHQAAGLGSGLVQHLQPALHHEVQNFSGETWSTTPVFHFRFTFLLPAGPVGVVSSLEGLYLVTASRLSPQAAAGKSPSNLRSPHSPLTLISPNLCQQNTKSHTHFHNVLCFVPTAPLSEEKPQRTCLRCGSPSLTPCLCQQLLLAIYSSKQKVLFRKCF